MDLRDITSGIRAHFPTLRDLKGATETSIAEINISKLYLWFFKLIENCLLLNVWIAYLKNNPNHGHKIKQKLTREHEFTDPRRRTHGGTKFLLDENYT